MENGTVKIPRVNQALRGFGTAARYQIIQKTISDFEAVETEVNSRYINLVLQPMKQRDLLLKPEGQRSWKWLDGFSTERLSLDWTLVDAHGRRYRIMGSTDWSQCGFYHYALVEGPEAPSA